MEPKEPQGRYRAVRAVGNNPRYNILDTLTHTVVRRLSGQVLEYEDRITARAVAQAMNVLKP